MRNHEMKRLMDTELPGGSMYIDSDESSTESVAPGTYEATRAEDLAAYTKFREGVKAMLADPVRTAKFMDGVRQAPRDDDPRHWY